MCYPGGMAGADPQRGEPPVSAGRFATADANDSGDLSIPDPIRTLGFLFLGGAEPPAPGPRECGGEPTPDGLGPCGTTCR